MVILYLVFLFPLTIGEYHKAGYGQFCSDTSTRIRNRYDCQVAAAALGLTWGKSWWGPWDFPGCLHTKDSRNKVYFNESPHPTNDPTSHPKMANYAEICTGEDQDKQYALVVTAGDNPNRIDSSDMISSMGVCVAPNTNIPLLPDAIAGAKSVWLQESTTLMFCGGSDTFKGHEIEYPNGWGARNKCLKLTPPGATVWDPEDNMKHNRSWFSLNNVNKGTIGAVAAGGLGPGYDNVLDSIEHFYNGRWEILEDGGGNPIKLDIATYGHCAVQFNIGTNSFLMIIAGSQDGTNFAKATNAVTVINLKTGEKMPQNPGALPKLWAPACVMKGEDIYVSGGLVWDGTDGTASLDVYKGTKAGDFVKIGSGLNVVRSGHTMGVTSHGPNGQMFVAGGYDPPLSGTYLKEIETSTDNGLTWNTLTMELAKGGEYAAMATVPAFTFTCPGP